MPCDTEAVASRKGVVVRAKAIVDVAHFGTRLFGDMFIEELESTE